MSLGDGTTARPLELADAHRMATAVPWQRWASWLVIACGAVPRVWAAIWDQSLFWPDEIFQTLEQAHRVAFGYGLLPWEFRDAARSWVFPGLIGLYWKVLALLGVNHSFGLVSGAKLLMVAAGLLTIELGRRCAERLVGPTAGLVATLFLAFCPLEIFFGARVMTEMASAPLLLASAYLGLVAERRRPALAGALGSAAIFLRYQNGLVLVGYLVILAVRKDWHSARRLAIAATIVGIAGGLLDWATWHYPFQAFVVYVKFNLIDGKASSFGTSPFYFYGQYLERSIGAALGILVLGLLASARRACGLVALVLIYVLVHCAIPHKELRFLLPAMPLALTLAAVGFADLGEALFAGPAFPVCAALLASAAMGAKAIAPTQRDYGRADSTYPLWHSGEDYFATEWEAEKKSDLCGIALVDNQPWWTGGYTYLHRHVPIYFNLDHLASINYVVGARDEKLPAAWKRVFADGKYALWRRDGSCSPDPGYKPWLN